MSRAGREKKLRDNVGGLPMTSEEKTAHILFKNKNYKKVAIMIRSMWEYRKYRKDNLRPP